MPSSGSPPPTPSLSTWSQTRRFHSDPIPLLTECLDELGDLFRLRLLGMGDWIFACSPGTVKQLFRAPKESLDAGVVHSRLLGSLFGYDATFNLSGERHRARQRTILPLLNGSAAEAYVPTILGATRERIAAWPIDERFSLLPESYRLSLRILVRALLGDEHPDLEVFAEDFETFCDRGVRSRLAQIPFLRVDLGRLSPWGRFLAVRERLASRLRREIRVRRQAEGPDTGATTGSTLLDALVRAEDEEGKPLSESAILDEALNLLFAGHETTGTVLTWAVECVFSRPAVRAAILAELEEVVGDEPLRAEHLRDLPFLDAVVQESIRFRPIGPFAAFREVVHPIEIEGDRGRFTLAAGSILAHAFPIMALRDDLYPRAREFRPERFLEPIDDKYTWTPFGGGGRVCSGKGLALVELKVVTATLVRECELELIRPSTRAVPIGHFLSPENGLPVILRSRSRRAAQI